jgi:hypothetical protein
MQTHLSEQSNYEPQLTLEIDCLVRSNLIDFVDNRCRCAVRRWLHDLQHRQKVNVLNPLCCTSSWLYALNTFNSMH